VKANVRKMIARLRMRYEADTLQVPTATGVLMLDAADMLVAQQGRIAELEGVLSELVEHRSHCFIPEEAREFPQLYRWTERASAALQEPRK
jgi:hypothetical protein